MRTRSTPDADSTPGVAVALVGIDGSGKTTAAQALARELRARADVSARYFENAGGRPPLDWLAHTLGRTDAIDLFGPSRYQRIEQRVEPLGVGAVRQGGQGREAGEVLEEHDGPPDGDRCPGFRTTSLSRGPPTISGDGGSPPSGREDSARGARRRPGAPEGDGWFFTLRLSDPAELETLMDEPTYREYVAKL